jgi:hypothetical protein
MSDIKVFNDQLQAELQATAEVLVDIAEEHGIYTAVKFLYDSAFDLHRIKGLMPILHRTPGSRK